ncbi:MAG TPA: primosome assembly protein PriA, partial [Micromonosporaceae bacterium]|nr:primosome assembly protein PriA [Micromonosporaceae bacterium]
VVVADGGLAPVQALVRWDPAWYAGRELADRAAVGFPPAARMASLTGVPQAVAELLELAELPAGTAVLGPVPVSAADSEGGAERMLLRVNRSAGPALAAALHAAAGVRSTRKARDPVRIQVDPRELW